MQLVISSLNNGDVTGAARLLATVFIQGGWQLDAFTIVCLYLFS